MEEKVSLKECFTNTWKEYFGKEDTIVSLLGDLGISDQVFKEIVTRRSIGDNRCVVIASTTKVEDGHLGKVIIDFKLGEPSWQQMMDVTFKIGSDCEKKIVIFSAPEDPEYQDYLKPLTAYDNRILVGSFARINNDCGFDTWLLRASISTDSNKVEPEYDVIEEPGDHRSTRYSKLPSKRDFEKAEFWVVYYDSFAGYFAGSGPTAAAKPDCWMGYGSWISGGGLEFRPTWTDKGLLMHATAESESGVDTLKWLWENSYDEIREKYKGEPKLHKKRGSPFKLSVRVSEISFTDVIYSTPQKKEEYAEDVFGREREFHEFLTELINRREPEMKVVNS